MDLGLITQTVSWLVALSGFVTWIVFIPQIKRLFDVKNSEAISLWSAWMSWALQALILLQAVLLRNWSLVFAMTMSVSFLTLEIIIVYYYRLFPGGKIKSYE